MIWSGARARVDRVFDSSAFTGDRTVADVHRPSPADEDLPAVRVVTPAHATAVPPRATAVRRGADDLRPSPPELLVDSSSDLGLSGPLPVLKRPDQRRKTNHHGRNQAQAQEFAHQLIRRKGCYEVRRPDDSSGAVPDAGRTPNTRGSKWHKESESRRPQRGARAPGGRTNRAISG